MDRYSKFILTVIALGLWALVIALFLQPIPVRAQYGVQQVEVVGWYVYTPIEVEAATPIEVDLKRIDGNEPLGALGWGFLTPPIPVEVQ